MATTFDLTAVEREAIERRRYRRVPATLHVRWSAPVAAHPEWIDADTVNVGAGGVLLRTVVPDGVIPGTPVCMSMDLDDCTVLAVAECCGARGGAATDGRSEVAFRFTAMERAALRALVHAVVVLETS